MEQWSIGMLKIPSLAGLIMKGLLDVITPLSGVILPLKTTSHSPKPIIPVFQYSNWGEALSSLTNPIFNHHLKRGGTNHV